MTGMDPFRFIECDVLVVGAGPAGSMAAKAAAKHGADVVMIDKRRRVGFPVQCAGYVPYQVNEYIMLEKNVIEQSVTSMITEMPCGMVEETKQLGYIVNREQFDSLLAEKATRAGASLITGCMATSHGHNATKALCGKEQLTIKSKVVVGADGPRSRVAFWTGRKNKDMVMASQWTVPLLKKLESTYVYFDRRFAGGYGWLFPRGGRANVGVGVERKYGFKPREALKWLVEKLARQGIIQARPLIYGGGLLAVGGRVRASGENIVLAGDAAGLCHPQTGAGVMSAVQSGWLAGEAAAKAAGGDDGVIDSYAKEIDELYSAAMEHAAGRRRLMEKFWKKSDSELSRALRYGWVAFPEYRLDMTVETEKEIFQNG